MKSAADQPAPNAFWFYEYLLMPQPTGKKTTNFRELLQYLQEKDEAGMEFHLWQSHLTITQTTVEFPDDFALWAVNCAGIFGGLTQRSQVET